MHRNETFLMSVLKILGVLFAVLFVAPLLVAVLMEFGGSDGSGGSWLLLAIALAVVAFVQHRQFVALRKRVDETLAEFRSRLYDETSDASASVDALRKELRDRGVLPTPAPPVGPAAAAAEPPQPSAAAAVEPPIATAAAAAAEEQVGRPPEGAPVVAVGPPVAEPPPALPIEVDERTPEVTTSAVASALAWFRGGNTIVRVAVLILFAGVAFLLRYAAEHDLLPIELRLAAVATGGVALLVTGWRLRDRRRGYGLTLQGAGIGVLYMTIYASMRLYDLVPPLAALATMVVIAGLAAVLALRQDALPLAVVGVVGGFAAPLLASSGAGSHVVLFGYCLVLNLGIALIANRRAWRLLNLVGFTCTALVAAAWGAVGWQPELLATTEPFLVAHWLLYLFVTVAYARRVSALSAAPGDAQAVWPYVDATLLFGVPLVAAGFQAVLVRHVPYALAASAAVMSAVYLLLGRWLWRSAGEQLRLLGEGVLALGSVFLMLVAPLALDARWTAGAWAVQGAGMVWIALRQRRAWALAFGLALQPLAALSFWARPLPDAGLSFVANARFTGVWLLAGSALVCGRLLHRARTAATVAWPSTWLGGLEAAAIALGLLHLVFGGARELENAPWAVPGLALSVVLWLVVLAVAVEALHAPLTWPQLAVAARPLLALAALVATVDAAGATLDDAGWRWLWPAGVAAVLATLAAGIWLLRRIDRPAGPSALARPRWVGEPIALAWFAMLHGGLAVYLVAAHFVARHAGWTAGAVIVLPTLLAWGVLGGVDRQRWPFDRDAGAWVHALALPWLGALLLWSLGVNLLGDGAMPPLPYVPLLNPVDLGHALLLLYALRLQRTMRSERIPTGERRLRQWQPQVAAAAALVGFWWLTSVLVRTLHHYAGTPMWGDGALESGLVQTGLSILWTVLALAAMLLATRRIGPRNARTVWLAGGALLAVVVVKLMLVDLSQTSALQRIVSFVGVGLLMLLVGYVAPLPPQGQGSEPRRGHRDA